MHRSPKKASDRAPGPVPRTTIAWWPAEWPPVRTTDTPGRSSRSPSAQPSAPQSATSRSSGWSYEATSRLLPPSATSHSARWATMRALGKALDPSASSRPPAWSKWRWLMATMSTVAGIEARRAHRRHDRRAPVLAHRGGLVVEPLPDPRLDQHPARGRLDEQAVQPLEQPSAAVELALRPVAPQDPRHRPEDRAGVRPEGPGLHQRDPGPAAEVGAPVATAAQSRDPSSAAVRTLRPRSKSACDADAVGSDWPWYFEPSSLLPYGRSTGELIRKKLICPIRIP